LGSLITICRVRFDAAQRRGPVSRNQRIWAIRIGLFVVILVVIIVATSH
jgi:hypothetical protein